MERDYAKEYADYHGQPEQIRRRAGRNKARRMLVKARGHRAMRGKDVDHKNFNPLDNSPTNLRVMDSIANRSRQPSR